MTKSRKGRKKSDIIFLPDYATLPEEFFRFSYAEIPNAEGKHEVVPRLVSQLIPFTFIKSLSLAIDPFWKFRTSKVKITPVNRTRTREIKSVLEKRSVYRTRLNQTVNVAHTTPSGCVTSPTMSSFFQEFNTNLGNSLAYITQTKDTTSRTRPLGSDLGEFEHFEFSTNSPSRSIAYPYHEATYDNSLVCPGNSNYLKYSEQHQSTIHGDSAVFSKSSLDSIVSSERTALLAEMQKKALGMLPKVLPERRQYSLFRNVIELKDLPGSIRSLRKAFEDFRVLLSNLPAKDVRRFITDLSANAKNIPGEYVSYHFGWRQLWNDVTDLLIKPEFITRDINKLIERSGKSTSFRLKQKYALDSKTTPSYEYTVFNGETRTSTATKIVREIELRMMVNAIFDFPTTGVPEFKRQLWLKKLGVAPTVTDVYNLIPWSWLVDWFTGLGDYISAIDSINADRSTFNYGFLTGTLTGTLKTDYHSEVDVEDWTRVLPGPWVLAASVQKYQHTSVLEYKLRIRKDITSAYGAKALAVDGGLSNYQTSILGALFAQRSVLKRDSART